MVVWLNTEAADSVALRAFLDDEPAVAVWWFADKEEAFEGFKVMFEDEPALVAQTAVEDLPASFWLQLVDTTSSREIEVLVTTLENQPDVAVVLEARTGEELEAPTGEEIAKNRDLARPGVGITVWIHPDATEVETSKLLELVREGSHPGSYRFFDQQASFAEFTRMFADDDEVLAAVEPSDLPSSIRIVFPEPATALELSEHRDRYRTEPGVRDVVIGELNDDFERPQVSSAQKN